MFLYVQKFFSEKFVTTIIETCTHFLLAYNLFLVRPNSLSEKEEEETKEGDEKYEVKMIINNRAVFKNDYGSKQNESV